MTFTTRPVSKYLDTIKVNCVIREQGTLRQAQCKQGTGKAFKVFTFLNIKCFIYVQVLNSLRYEEGWMVDNFSFAAASGTTSLLSRATTTIAVPESFTILGTGTAIIFGTLFKRTNSPKKSKTS
ncbi:PEP-CTERM sorting domain-containing protein [Gloeothece verrucosa]|uniref:Uncharacterized protein n=1 Tax=Gloeothece verrucosa (strain PCC 7822) TaxID=497965 RepID=E0UL46_GLOV7|nr:PEP-CTERM sorting domain-containing protein [Gloeothece verrucosa]ADN17676.1 hypothetical protein Cyan7822_5822 [Gloeothece verrucosa PCC 7822]